MNKNVTTQIPSFLTNEPEDLDYSIFQLNLYLNGYNEAYKPYKIDYHLLVISYHLWEGRDLEEFCQKQTICYFLMNPMNDSAEAREAFCFEIREFLLGI
ncbi:hypothetical protein [Flagellimonas sp. S3867]|uniref:hypothetical protein n=1 Tax=Flagellimonas sp. S3867 TaxID=2768063 RepID=UPI0016895FB1|nr:hypothetical protein [Flagellimonas sp. S3867]